MIKSLFLNKKKVPIPVPLRTLQEVVEWVESYLVQGDKTITKIVLDGEEIEPLPSRPLPVGESSKLFIQVDSPVELAVQTIDALRNMCSILLKNIKHRAVFLWGTSPSDRPEFVDEFFEDFTLLLNLSDHVMVLLSGICQTKNIENLTAELTDAEKAQQIAISQSDWRGLAKVMLRQVEPRLVELSDELSHLQRLVFEMNSNSRARAVVEG